MKQRKQRTTEEVRAKRAREKVNMPGQFLDKEEKSSCHEGGSQAEGKQRGERVEASEGQ